MTAVAEPLTTDEIADRQRNLGCALTHVEVVLTVIADNIARTRDIGVSPMRHALERRLDFIGVLDEHEDSTRFLLDADRLHPAVDDALWSATWQLRLDVIAALDRCERAERDSRFAR
jgi:hypothetical protein